MISERAKSTRRRGMFMPRDDEERPDRGSNRTLAASPRTWTRRDWIKAGVIAGAAAGAGTVVGAEVLAPLLSPPLPSPGTIRDDFVYTKFPDPQWWDGLVGDPVHVGDFQVWQGATAVWRGLFRDGTYVERTGLPVLIVRIIRDDTHFRSPDPAPYPIPSGYNLYYDDPARDLRIVVLFDRCTHLCCYPGWHIVYDQLRPPRDYSTYGAPPPTWTVYNQDPVWCVCHDAQYDPLLLAADVNPTNGVPFVGAKIVHGPGTFNLPIVPVRPVRDILYGGMPDPRWYEYC
jgi:Rieske Fe-S protein